MDISLNFIKLRSNKPNFLSKDFIARILSRKNAAIKSPTKLALDRRDSNSTTINHKKISNTLNTEILFHKLKPLNYKRAESELRQILCRPFIKEKSEKIRQKSSVYRKSGILRKSYRLNDSFIRNKDYDSSSFLQSIKALKLRENIEKSCSVKKQADLAPISIKYSEKTIEKQVNLIPISIQYSETNSPKGKLSEKQFGSQKKNWTEKREISHYLILARPSSRQSPEIAKTLKSISENKVDDWKKSVLYHNMKHNKDGLELLDGYYKKELEELVRNLPEDNENLLIVFKKLFCTLEKLLIELLGTQDDFENFQRVCNQASEKMVRFLIEKCLTLCVFRDKTCWIVENILKREQAMEKVKRGNVNCSIEIFSVSNKIKKCIEDWLADPCAPFSHFIFDGEDYIERIDRDLGFLHEYGLA